jgi:hypothetical protein
VTEEAPLGAAEQERLANETYSKIIAMPTAPASGQAAVQSAVDAGAMQGAASAPGVEGDASSTVRVVGARTFVLSGGKWIDTAFDPDKMQTKKIDFLSKDYFRLINAHTELADAFALGEQVIALADGVAYEVLASDAPAQIVTATPTPAPFRPDDPVVTPTKAPVQVTPSQTPAKQLFGPCGVGVLPFFLVPLFVSIVSRRRK